MGRVYKPFYRTRAGERKQTARWYAEWTDASGKSRRKVVSKDRRAAEAYLARMQDIASRQRHGLEVVTDAARVRSLTDWQADYLAAVGARDVGAAYVENITRQLAAVVKAGGWLIWTDVAAADVTRYLAGRRAKGDSNATLNTYLNAVKTFARWVGDRLGTPSPLRGLKRYNDETTRRRSRRVLTDAEVEALVACAGRRRGGGANGGITGAARAMLYRVALGTGLRASELASLTSAAFALDATPPTVTVEARHAKSGRTEPVPIPAHLVAVLRPWLAGKPAGERVWPGTWAARRRQHEWVARDVASAGIAERDEKGQRITFHCLRKTYITRLIRAGAKVHQLRRLARHRDVTTTLNHYTDETMGELAALSDLLPPA